MSSSLNIKLAELMRVNYIISGWWFQPLRKVFVSWDDDIPNILLGKL